MVKEKETMNFMTFAIGATPTIIEPLSISEMKAKGYCPECYGKGAILNSHKCSEYYKKLEKSMTTHLLPIPKREKPHILIPLSLVMELYAELMLINTDKDLAARLLKLVDGNDG